MQVFFHWQKNSLLSHHFKWGTIFSTRTKNPYTFFDRRFQFLGLAILIPSLYVAVAFKLQVGFPKYSKKFSFVKMSTPLFSVFFGLLSSLLVIFAIVFSIVLRKIPPSYGNVSKRWPSAEKFEFLLETLLIYVCNFRKRLLMGAASQTVVTYLFVIALIVYTNGIVQFGKELLLAAACLLVVKK